MRVAVIGAGWIGAEFIRQCAAEGRRVVGAVDTGRCGKTAMAALEAGVAVAAVKGPVVREMLPGEFDVLVNMGSREAVAPCALGAARLAAIGYHPSLLPRWRGVAAVQWTARAKDPIAGGTIYHLSDRFDAGAIALQDWCHVLPGEGATALWRRRLGPMGLELMAAALVHLERDGRLPAVDQMECFQTAAPAFRAALGGS